MNDLLFADPARLRASSAPAEEPYAWWASLNHGGLLIAPSKLAERFPARVEPLPAAANERLRRDLTRLQEGGDERLAAFLDTVLEDLLGLNKARFKKGSEVDKAWSQPAVTGEIIRPRRVWLGPNGAALPVFVDTAVARLGVGRGKRPVSRVVEWLRRIGQDPGFKVLGVAPPRVALLANTRQVRLIHAGTDYDAFCEWDTALWFSGGAPGPQVQAIRALLSAEALTPPAEGKLSKLVEAIQASRQGQAELSSALGERVRQAVELLIRESAPVLEHIDAGEHGNSGDAGRVARRHIYVAATRLVMRCVVILFAEARELLPRSNAVYEGSYGLEGLRAQLDRMAGGRAAERLRHSHGAWPRLLSLFRLVYHGSAHEALPVPRYGGGLFTPGDAASPDPVLRALAAFESARNEPTDHAVHGMLELLCKSRVRVRQGRTSKWVEAPVDFSDLSSEYLGILYEGLLDFELRRAPADDAIVFLNLGSQPALPLQRLDRMKNEELGQLLDKLKKSGEKVQAEGEGEGEDAADEEGAGDIEAEDDAGSEAEAEEGAAAPAADALDELGGDDRARVVRELAQTWAERAVKAAKLVKYPKRDTDPRVREQWNRDVAATARGLVQRLILPGGWFLVRWGGTRKGSGTFYTRPQLAGPIVRRALQPLAHAAVREEKDEATGLVSVTEWAPRKPEEILALKVCDPAMGSGSFLISALRYLTGALVESLHHHGRLEERADQTICRLADGLPADHPSHETLPVPKDHPDFDERLRARLKRYVVERCLYGVDLDPLAVELGRTALWVETMDRQLPFGFLDHKLKCGNSLVGCWFDRFQDYPIMAWEREGGDKGHVQFVHHYREVVGTKGKDKGKTQRLGDKWTAAIKERRDGAIKPELMSWLTQRDPKQVALREADGKDADGLHAEALAVFEELHALPVHEAEARETLYREKIKESAPIQRLKAAFDTWCALWFWPGDEIESAPGPKDFLDPSERARAIVARLADDHRFFHWELEFPDVFTGPRAGFQAVVGNPPWEIQKPNSMEFFSNLDPLYRTYGKQEALKGQKQLFETVGAAERDWLVYSARFKALSNWTKNAAFPFGGSGDEGTALSLGRGREGEELLERWTRLREGRRSYGDAEHPFRHQGSGIDTNTYKMFLEMTHALLGSRGRLGLLVPSGLYTDNGSRPLRDLFLKRCAWTHLYAFQNERFVFEGIDHRFKMAVAHIEKGDRTAVLLTRFRIGPGGSPESHEIESDLTQTNGYLPLRTEQITLLSPTAGALPELMSGRDLQILENIFANSIRFGDDSVDGWNITHRQEFHMTHDAALFQPSSRHVASSLRPTEIDGIWVTSEGDTLVPLIQGAAIEPYNYNAKAWVRGTGVRAVWEYHEPRLFPYCTPQFLVTLSDCTPRIALTDKLIYRRVARNTDTRTVIAAVVPGYPVADKTPTVRSPLRCASFLISAAMNSYTFDYVARLRCGGTQIDHHLMTDLPLPSPRTFPHAMYKFAVRLIAPAPSFSLVWWREWGHAVDRSERAWRHLWAVTPHERLRLRAILDAAVAELYGLDIDDFAWILRDCDHPAAKVCDKPFSRTLDPKGFWRVDKEQDPELRHPVLSLVAFHELKRIGLDAFLALNDGDGWVLPETLRLADYGLGHDARAREPQPVAARLGDRFLPWQFEQGVEESWEECRRHAELIEKILGPALKEPAPVSKEPAPAAATAQAPPAGKPYEVTPQGQALLFAADPAQKDLFGNAVEPAARRGKKKR
ncbi:hypothetical protein BE20_24240 [Sorangium cellulosum]|uniref:site-specific DNA-methyltransferase (adenine-specific) n=1 Tax=Sorangium cellulosum TaxID=56 RepID=A0A150REV8_SORCE|nr:hypothetical protein BE18_53315 [Sorangium cellulosum]KYF87959.1 hypothetical protein BE20_24240 [Sorangium cellulosum]